MSGGAGQLEVRRFHGAGSALSAGASVLASVAGRRGIVPMRLDDCGCERSMVAAAVMVPR